MTTSDREPIPTEKPSHPFNDPDEDGHDCETCDSASIWKCDKWAHIEGGGGILTVQARKRLHAQLDVMARQRRQAYSAENMGMPLP